jgi:hypothetical protein
MIEKQRRKTTKRMSLGADKAYDTQDFVGALREFHVTPHGVQNDRNRDGASDQRTTRHQSYQIRQAKRYWVEKPLGWMKSVGLMRKMKLRGREKPGGYHFYGGGLQSVADSKVAGRTMLKPLPGGPFGPSPACRARPFPLSR